MSTAALAAIHDSILKHYCAVINKALQHLTALYVTGEITRTDFSPRELEMLAAETCPKGLINWATVASYFERNQAEFAEMDSELDSDG